MYQLDFCVLYSAANVTLLRVGEFCCEGEKKLKAKKTLPLLIQTIQRTCAESFRSEISEFPGANSEENYGGLASNDWVKVLNFKMCF